MLKKILAVALVSAVAISTPALAAGRHGGGSHGGAHSGHRGHGGHGGHGWHGGGHRHGGHYGHGHGYYGYGYGYGYGAAVVGSAIVAGALLSPWYYPSYYASYPAVVETAPTVYVEQAQSAQPIASDAASYWYYCNDTRAYYPYVQTCASPWQRVSPTPGPNAAPR
jgi:hypothetical protein